MSNYIDAFIFPISNVHLDEYQSVSKQVAAIWKEHGAIAYFEYLSDDLNLSGTKSFSNILDAREDESIIFGWTVFESKEVRDLADRRVAADERMESIVGPIVDKDRMIFNAARMVFGGFKSFVGED